MRSRAKIAFGLLLLLPICAAARVRPVGREFQVNSYTRGNQFGFAPAVAVGGDGVFVVVWEANLPSESDGSGSGVFGQLFDSVGHRVGKAFQVNSFTLKNQFDPAVAGSVEGGFVVAWGSYGQDGDYTGVFVQRYDGLGQAEGTEFQANTYTSNTQSEPEVAAGPDGAFVVAWSSYGQDGSDRGVFARRYDSAGRRVGKAFQVNSYTTAYQRSPAVAAGADGFFVVTWESYQDGSQSAIFGKRYDSTGEALGTEFQVNSYTTGGQSRPAVAAGADGAFAIVWWGGVNHDGGGPADDPAVFAQRYDRAGRAAGSEFLVNIAESPAFYTSIAVATDGAFVVVWDTYGQDNGGPGVFAQRYNSVGRAVGREFQVNSYTRGVQRSPAVAAAADGGFVVVWNSDKQDGSVLGVFGQVFAELISCAGDCGGDGTVSVDELITGVEITLGLLPSVGCPAFDIDESGQITIDELVAAVDSALHGCTE